MDNLIEAHKFFVRKSQHYILGNWSCFIPLSLKKIKRYYLHYPIAYVKFMWLSLSGQRRERNQ